MKTLRIIPFIAVLLSLAHFGFAQKQTNETIKVSGECGMCKKKIEKAAKDAGATYAVWNTDTKILTLKYNSQSTNSEKIQQKIADVGYDTPKFRATDEAYNKLEQCCQYDRQPANTDNKDATMQCEMKDGKCVNEAACKDKGCCKDPEKCKDMGCSGNGMSMNGKMNMQKSTNGKMAMNCSDDKNCCQKKTGQ
ncbi:MAG TPA: heavy-metal-associated domain-containing protein [Chitinophagaceae bacterium]|jgi:hypothetical protein|nr:heavy-metal-associated domain-containing protein [Chitinophagaceae bacterium]